MTARRRHKKEHHEEHENHERWLVSGYDMMTLLFAVFVVLYAISSTNISKVKALQQSLKEAFSGPVLSGGRAMMATGDESESNRAAPGAAAALDHARPGGQGGDGTTDRGRTPSVAQAARAGGPGGGGPAGAQEANRRARSREAGLGKNVSTTVSRRGLEVRLLTDKLFFDSGSAVVKMPGVPVIEKIGTIVADEKTHPVEVEGHTDDRPIRPLSTRPTGSCRAPARAPSCSASSAPASAAAASRSADTPHASRSPPTGPTPAGPATAGSRSSFPVCMEQSTSQGGDTP